MNDLPTPNGRRGHSQPVSRHKASSSACTVCHVRKVKCDVGLRGVPCTNCLNADNGDCKVHEKKRRRAQATDASRGRQSSAGRPGTGPASQGKPTSSPSNDREYKRHLVQFVDQSDIDKRAIHEGVRITYLGSEVSNLNFLLRLRDIGEGSFHYPTDRISRHLTGLPLSRIPLEVFALPEKPLVDSLLAAYFEGINRAFPLFDEDAFMAHYAGRNPANPPSLLALHVMLLVGAHVSCSLPQRDQLKSMFFDRARMLIEARFERNRDIVVQATILLSWYSDGAEDVSANAWSWIGTSARHAYGLGMHRDPAQSLFVAQERRTWRRTWWLLVQYDILVALFHGRPAAIDLDVCDVNKLTEDDFNGGTVTLEVDFQIQRSAICVLIARAVKAFRPATTAEHLRSAVNCADKELAEWYTGLPPAIRYDASQHNHLSAQLALLYYNILLLLHREYRRPKRPSSSSTSPVAHRSEPFHLSTDASICNVSAQAIISIFEILCAKNEIRYLWLDAVNALYSAVTHLSTVVQSANPILAVSAQAHFESGLRSLREVAKWWPIASAIEEMFSTRRTTGLPTPHVERGNPFGSPANTEQAQVTSRQEMISRQGNAVLVTPLHHNQETPYMDGQMPVEAAESQWAHEPVNPLDVDWRQLFPFTETDQLNLFDYEQDPFDAGQMSWNSSYTHGA